MMTMNGALWATILVVVLASQCQPITAQTLAEVMAKLVEIQATVTSMQTKIDKIDNIQTQVDCIAQRQPCDGSTTTPSATESSTSDTTTTETTPTETTTSTTTSTTTPSTTTATESSTSTTITSESTTITSTTTDTPSTTTTTTAAPSSSDTTTSTINRENNTLVQQNLDGSAFFVKNWADYKAGFGNESGNYWIGNDRLHALTKTGLYKLRVDLLYDLDNNWYYAEYSPFIVGNETSNYTMSYSGFNGTAGNWLYNDTQFSTSDGHDNDGNAAFNCVTDENYGAGGGFWYPPSCGNVFINTPDSIIVRSFTWPNNLLGDTVSNWQLQTSRMTLLY